MVGPWSCSPASGLHTSSLSSFSFVRSFVCAFSVRLLIFCFTVSPFSSNTIFFSVCIFSRSLSSVLSTAVRGGKRGARKIPQSRQTARQWGAEEGTRREVWDPTLLVFAYFLFTSFSSVLNVFAVAVVVIGDFLGVHLTSPSQFSVESWSRAVVITFVKKSVRFSWSLWVVTHGCCRTSPVVRSFWRSFRSPQSSSVLELNRSPPHCSVQLSVSAGERSGREREESAKRAVIENRKH